ncbi:SDR family NAD(P)-dependent oxidoreductase [Microbacterium sp. HA-8]|uniref:SDR family NAD(P)-dependent oxidoreductase n=1 Tax=Microbacterium sp. HA-8 TaxID=3234200 RepID=UPI0038F740CA
MVPDGDPKRPRVAVVTGGASGIGAAVIAGLVNAGYVTASLDWAAEEKVSSHGLSISADVRDPESVERAVSRVLSTFGRIDVLVNCAGVGLTKAFLETSISDWNRVVGVNLTGTFLVSQCVARWMAHAGSGAIVNVGSTATVLGTPGQTAYAASKGAVVVASGSADAPIAVKRPVVG